MRSVDYPEPFRELARELRRLPGIGPRTAERIALWLASSKDARPLDLAGSLRNAAENLRSCRTCGFFSTNDLCEICRAEDRTGREICVVEQATDILPLERTGSFEGRYHVLGGRLAPLDHIGPEQLRIGELLERAKTEAPSEIILALSADVEGEATTNYLAEILSPLGIAVTRIAHGLPAGGGLEHADPLTLQRALAGRNPLKV
ncbi:MAG TPA: recombination mediator RecR [Terrimicrobiaceae bacterium]|jgi:recombination protein RecR|nr:recombination mediator RecR [Terrimicrobiaceae bacterium]